MAFGGSEHLNRAVTTTEFLFIEIQIQIDNLARCVGILLFDSNLFLPLEMYEWGSSFHPSLDKNVKLLRIVEGEHSLEFSVDLG